MVANSEQILNKVTSRRLLTYEKVYQTTEEELRTVGNEIIDFREKYFVVREESRKERRLKRANERKENWLKHISNK